MNILLTGGSGFIGSHLSNEILKDDKKSKSDSVDIVLLSDISQPNLISISFDELIEVIQN